MKGTPKSKHWKTKDHTHNDETGIYQYNLVCEESDGHSHINVTEDPQNDTGTGEDEEDNVIGACFAAGLLVFIIGAILMMAFF